MLNSLKMFRKNVSRQSKGGRGHGSATISLGRNVRAIAKGWAILLSILAVVALIAIFDPFILFWIYIAFCVGLVIFCISMIFVVVWGDD